MRLLVGVLGDDIEFFMIADVDFFFKDGAGQIFGGEIKTTNIRSIEKWSNGLLGDGGELPENYEWQVRHYMAVMGLPAFFVVCCYGNNPNDIKIVRIDRDTDKEKKLIEQECIFWSYVSNSVCPKEDTIGEQALQRLNQDYIY